MQPQAVDRYTVTIDAERTMSVSDFRRTFVCDACGSIPSQYRAYENGTPVCWMECPTCHGREFVDGWTYQRQVQDAKEIISHLPPTLRELVGHTEPQRVTAAQAVAELYE